LSKIRIVPNAPAFAPSGVARSTQSFQMILLLAAKNRRVLGCDFSRRRRPITLSRHRVLVDPSRSAFPALVGVFVWPFSASITGSRPRRQKKTLFAIRWHAALR